MGLLPVHLCRLQAAGGAAALRLDLVLRHRRQCCYCHARTTHAQRLEWFRVDEQLSVTVTSCMSRRKLVSREETTTRTQHNNNSNINNNNSNSNSSINCEQQHKPQQHRAPLAFL